MTTVERLQKEHFLSNRYGTENEEVCDCGLDAHQCDALTLITFYEKQPTWWYCVWCETKYPYSDTVDVLKSHSAKCEAHPGNAHAKALAEALSQAQHGALGDRIGWDNIEDGTVPRALAATEPMQAIARQANEQAELSAEALTRLGAALAEIDRLRPQAAIGADAYTEAAHAKALAEALIWASGSDDFAPGGKARQGWERVAQPALTAYDKDHER